MHDHRTPHNAAVHAGAPIALPAIPMCEQTGDAGTDHTTGHTGGHTHTRRRRRPAHALRAANPGHSPSQSPGLSSPPGSGPNQESTPADEDIIHSAGGLSGSEHEADIQQTEDEPSDPEQPPNTPLADEKRAILVYAARNLTNTIDTRPVGTAWFSA